MWLNCNWTRLQHVLNGMMIIQPSAQRYPWSSYVHTAFHKVFSVGQCEWSHWYGVWEYRTFHASRSNRQLMTLSQWQGMYVWNSSTDRPSFTFQHRWPPQKPYKYQCWGAWAQSMPFNTGAKWNQTYRQPVSRPWWIRVFEGTLTDVYC